MQFSSLLTEIGGVIAVGAVAAETSVQTDIPIPPLLGGGIGALIAYVIVKIAEKFIDRFFDYKKYQKPKEYDNSGKTITPPK